MEMWGNGFAASMLKKHVWGWHVQNVCKEFELIVIFVRMAIVLVMPLMVEGVLLGVVAELW